MITIAISRDSVAAGDDTESHVREFELEDTATLADVIVYVVEHHLYAAVGGDVAWKLSAGGLELHTTRDGGSRYMTQGEGKRSTDFALISMDCGPDGKDIVSVNNLILTGLHQSLRKVYVLTDEGPDYYLFHLRYLPGGRRLPFAEFATWAQSLHPAV